MRCVACGEAVASGHEGPCPACGAEPRLRGRFSLLAPIGAGAHGTTWRATDGRDGATVAVKELPLRLGAPDKVVALFRREAEVLRQLDHPAIPTFVDAFEAGHGRSRALWIAMAFVDGQTLAQELEAHRYDEGEVLAILEELCDVLSYLHARQPPVVHRDLKPTNVIRRPDGGLSLIDFGSVRDAIRSVDLGGSTIAGTFGYMAPEQFGGDAAPRSDLYALGALAIHLLTRLPPHTLQGPGRPIDVRAHAAVRPGFADLLGELLALDPAARPASAAAVRARAQSLRAALTQAEAAPATPRADVASPALPARVATAPAIVENPGASSLDAASRTTAIARRAVTPADEASLLDAIAETLALEGDGRMTATGFRWESRGVAGRKVRVAVDPDPAGSRIRVVEDHRSSDLGILFGFGGGVLGGVGGGVGWLFFVEWGLASGFVFLAGLAVATVLTAVALARSVRRTRDARAATLATELQARLGGAASPAVLAPAPALRPLYVGAVGAAVATAWVLFELASAPLGPWWVAIIVLAVALGGLAKAPKARD